MDSCIISFRSQNCTPRSQGQYSTEVHTQYSNALAFTGTYHYYYFSIMHSLQQVSIKLSEQSVIAFAHNCITMIYCLYCHHCLKL